MFLQHPWGWDYSGSSNMAELQLLLEEKIMIRYVTITLGIQSPKSMRQARFFYLQVVYPGTQNLLKCCLHTFFTIPGLLAQTNAILMQNFSS